MKTTFAVNWQYGTATHSGWYRADNEDRSTMRIGTTEQGEPYAILVLADGMGGSGDGLGAEASRMAIEAVKRWMDESLTGLFAGSHPLDDMDRQLRNQFVQINDRLVSLGEERGSPIGTTLTVIALYKEAYLIVHTGDCRVYYRKPEGGTKLLTQDQTWVAEQVRKRRLPQHKADNHPNRHILLQCLGMNKLVSVWSKRGFYLPHSLFLMCSDGLYHRYKRDELERFLGIMERKRLELQQMCKELVDMALDRGANDNVTALLIRPMIGYTTPKQRMRRNLRLFWRQTLPSFCKSVYTNLRNRYKPFNK